MPAPRITLLLSLFAILATAGTAASNSRPERSPSPPVVPVEDGESEKEDPELAAWRAFAEEHDYEEHWDETHHILLLSTSRSRLKKYTKLATKTEAEVSGFVPAFDADEGESVPDPTQPIVLIELEDLEHQKLALASMVKRHSYLSAWAQSQGGRMVGFVTEAPLVGTWIRKVSGREKFDPENEHCHRLTQLLLLRRFGRLPFWLLNGFAWRVEQNLRGDIDCFPYRNGFVFDTEHNGWAPEVRAATKGSRDPFDMERLSSWRRGTYSNENAGFAWAAASYLCQKHAEKLPALFTEFGRQFDLRGRVTKENGDWERIVGFELTAEDQTEILEKVIAPSFRQDLRDYFATGRIKKKIRP